MLNGKEEKENNNYEDFRSHYFNIFNRRFMVGIFTD